MTGGAKIFLAPGYPSYATATDSAPSPLVRNMSALETPSDLGRLSWIAPYVQTIANCVFLF